MILREFLDKDTENKNRLYIEAECEICNSVFKRQKRFLTTHTCSDRCRNVLKGSVIVTVCGFCNTEFDLRKSRKLDINYCCRKCKDAAGINLDYRRKALVHFGEICQRCGFDNVLALQVHHKDRNRNNNDILNLEVLCCNCYSIEHKGH